MDTNLIQQIIIGHALFLIIKIVIPWLRLRILRSTLGWEYLRTISRSAVPWRYPCTTETSRTSFGSVFNVSVINFLALSTVWPCRSTSIEYGIKTPLYSISDNIIKFINTKININNFQFLIWSILILGVIINWKFCRFTIDKLNQIGIK